MNKYKEILKDNSKFKIWEKLDNGCYIGTLGYSEENILILQNLLMSFAEHYGEDIDYEAAKEELQLYEDSGKLFIYFDENMDPVSMNGCIYNMNNDTVDFISNNGKELNSLYFYGLSTLPKYRGKGACHVLVNYAIQFAKENGFDFVFARTDLKDSMSEYIMQCGGLEICKKDDMIIAEWVDVTYAKGDYRLHMYMPLNDNISVDAKGQFYLADKETRKIIYKNKTNSKEKVYGKY